MQLPVRRKCTAKVELFKLTSFLIVEKNDVHFERKKTKKK